MATCNKCGKEIRKNTGVYRVMKTGSMVNGSNFYRNVNLCQPCNKFQSEKESADKTKRGVLLAIVVGGATAAVCMWLISQGIIPRLW